ncbi:MAG: Crp/Fnr family transcriptional regulator [Ruminococcus sp.]|nr:Crp/Fnr family transcriptional regulator [Ruminococcus sp.]
MQEYFEKLRQCMLFEGVADNNLQAMLRCLGARVQHCKKGEIIMAEGEKATHIGVLLSGSVQLVRMDYYGNRSIVANIRPPQLFGESFVCAEVQAMPVSTIATEDCTILQIEGRRVLSPCCNVCDFHNRTVFNLMKIVATKNLLYHQKIEVTSKRTTREKLMTYLLLQEKEHGSSSFTIPFDRQELADFLEVERSGLSTEIGKLKKEGIIACERSRFRLLTEKYS